MAISGAIIQNQAQFFPINQAKQKAIVMTDQDELEDGWKYVCVDCGNGMGKIEVFDDEGLSVGFL